MAAPKRVRGRTWEDRDTRVLLEKWGDENVQLRLKSCTRKKPLWQEIGDILVACGYEDRDGEARSEEERKKGMRNDEKKIRSFS